MATVLRGPTLYVNIYAFYYIEREILCTTIYLC